MVKGLFIGGLIFITVDTLFILCACNLSSKYDEKIEKD
jgi:hypothetical protein